MTAPVFPNALKKGEKIAVVSPAGLVEEAALQKSLSLIESKGYEPVLGKHVLGKFENGYGYSGTEKERAQDLNWALNDKDITAVWASRGGYGCLHLLEYLELAAFKKQPKWYIGYSDNTVIQSYLLKEGYASIHGQTIKTPDHGVSEKSYEDIFGILEGTLPEYRLQNHAFNKAGKAAGQLVGGNLALVYALLGTPYSFDFKDNILFIEDIGEDYYALDRMLMSLELAGVFRNITGLVVGGMSLMGPEKDRKEVAYFDEKAYDIIQQRIQRYTFPVVFNFPAGHIYDNRPLVIGAKIKIEVKDEANIKFIR